MRIPTKAAAILTLAVLAPAVWSAPALAGPALAGPALAADHDSRVTWSVVPADAAGPDGRRVVDLELAPGERATEHVAVTNHSADEVTFALSANDGYLTERGSFDMRPSAVEPVDGGAWITVPDEVVVGPGETEVVPVEVAVPEGALPGDHPAGVAASVRSGGEMQVESRVGVRMNLRVPGEVVAALDAELLGVSFTHGPSLFEPGSLVMRYAVVNGGSVALDTTARVGAHSRFGGPDASAPQGEALEVLPGGRREVSVEVPGVWPLGPFGVEAVISAVVVDGAGRLAGGAGGAGEAGEADDVPAPADVTLTDTAWALPLLHVLVLLALVLAGWAARRALRARRARLDRLIERARAEGRAEVLAGRG
ncbi:WxL protein peptidoglycan domain-containing protein [Promicromonospora kroppenstedtii]|uniref:WxL protein peptidoglycan domain-containing protein n=1 Tax=Promicromonospora kroppenstedtii TaxID=440482 RepID=A0ABW7XEZ3_9MICO